MATSSKSSQVHYDNVTSMAVSYDYERIAMHVCTGLTPSITESGAIKRTKKVTLEVANLDLESLGGAVGRFAQTATSQYREKSPGAIYANGKYVGNGYLVDYSISEGSQSNLTTTSVTYAIIDGSHPSVTGANLDGEEDPVKISESTTVSRDIKNKEYTIVSEYSISYPDSFEAVTEYPLYKDNPEYETVDGRLSMGAKKAEEALSAKVNYNNYIDLSAFQTQNGWNFESIRNSNSGYFTSSSKTEDMIKGDYSQTNTIRIKYTGEDMEDGEAPSWTANYTMTFNEGKECTTATMNGTIVGQAGKANDPKAASTKANEGYQSFVVGGTAQSKLEAFFSSLKGKVEGTTNTSLNPQVRSLTKETCKDGSIVDFQGASAAGQENGNSISFSFEMDNCKDNKTDEPVPYTASETVSSSYSYQKDCDGLERKLTSVSVNGSVKGECGLQVDGGGTYQRWNNVKSIFNTKKGDAKTTAEAEYAGDYQSDFKIVSESETINEYEANGSYSVSYDDSPKACNFISECFEEHIKTETTEAESYKAKTATQLGFIVEEKAQQDPGRKKSIVTLKSPERVDGEECKQDLKSFTDKLKEKLNDNAPSCLIESLNWSFAKKFAEPTEIKGEVGGVELS